MITRPERVGVDPSRRFEKGFFTGHRNDIRDERERRQNFQTSDHRKSDHQDEHRRLIDLDRRTLIRVEIDHLFDTRWNEDEIHRTETELNQNDETVDGKSERSNSFGKTSR